MLVIKKSVEQYILSAFESIPVVSFYAKTRGWPFVIAWMHRIAGILLAFYLLLHIYTLSSLSMPQVYDAKMKSFGLAVFVFLEWLLAVPVIFHALNGGRLIIYELFGGRDDDAMRRWVLSLAFIFVLLQALLMIMGNQSVSPVFFWLVSVVISGLLVFAVANRALKITGSLAWKLQRISGAFLLVMIPAHLLFMHLQPATGHQADVIIARMQHVFIKLVDLLLVTSALYHAGYGLISIIKDYIRPGIGQNILSLLVIFNMVIFCWIGIKLIVLI
jgi:succinate dehydrogenase / fumarate reductase cytochrome b subunit